MPITINCRYRLQIHLSVSQENTVYRDFVKCRYEERVIKIDIFEGVSLRCVSLSTTTKRGL